MNESTDNRSKRSSSNAGARQPGSSKGDFQQAVERLEAAVHDLVGSAGTGLSDKATSLLNEATARIEDEFSAWASTGTTNTGTNTGRNTSAADRMAARRRARRQSRRTRQRSTGLYRDPDNAKIGGVCAGIARYYGMEVWVVRCLAITGLLFFGSIVFPAYWIAYFVMPKPAADGNAKNRDRSARRDHTSPAPELGTAIAPRRSLRGVQTDFSEVELRLRRMEKHVTSGRYELQRELNKIDVDAPVTSQPENAGHPGRNS